MMNETMVQEGNDSLSISSDSHKKLMAGFNATMASTQKASKEKIEQEKVTEYICNSCNKKFASPHGMKIHWAAKSNKCESKKGYSTSIAQKDVGEGEGLSKKGYSHSDMAKMASDSTAELRGSVVGRGDDGNKVTVSDLGACPTIKLEDKLRQAGTAEIAKFVAQRFHPSNASRKYLAEKELEKRKG